MSQQVRAAALAVFVIFGGIALVTAREPEAPRNNEPEAPRNNEPKAPRNNEPEAAGNNEPKAARKTEPKAAGGAPESSPKQITNSIGMKLTLVPSGEFMMGSGESVEDTTRFFKEKYGIDWLTADLVKNEHPQHRVRITKPFFLGTYHVTRGQFRQFITDSVYQTDAERGSKPGSYGWDAEKKTIVFSRDFSWRKTGFVQTDEHPVVNVSWNDALAFCDWLSKKEGKKYRLPTEAEWEYACRAGTTTRYSSGDDPETLARVANVCDVTTKAKLAGFVTIHPIKASDGFAFTAPVGHFEPNGFGLYEMPGNASQWCADRYGKDYYSESPTDDPTGPETGSSRVLRGDSWNGGLIGGRSANRYSYWPTYRSDSIGFRVARTQ
jgi:formylglycine-generating enzyme required for sulfatase activity